jgi:ABC-type transporter Mla MlaB component
MYYIDWDKIDQSRRHLMTIRMSGTEAHLEGDWTLDGAARNIDSLALSLQQIESGRISSLRIDCRQVVKTDAGGLQLLHVWLECARIRGVEPTLVNVPETLLQAMQGLIGHCFIDTCPVEL